MEFNQIVDIDSLGKWLQGKPYTWEQSIAFRSTMRALPVLNIAKDDWLDKFAVAVLRPIIVLDSLKNHNAMLHPSVISKAVIAAQHASNSAPPPVAALGRAAANALKSECDIEEDPHDFLNFDLHSNAIYAINFAITAIVTAEQDPVDAELREEQMWVSLRSDCFWLERNATLSKFKRISNRNRIWSSSPPMGWSEDWVNLKGTLQRIDPNYSVWIDWYDRRIRGERAAFDIPGDKRRIEDKKILRRLAEATDEDFWGDGHEYVNATLKGWLDEARARVAPPPIQAEVSGTFEITGDAEGTVQTPLQNRNAISFRTDEDGRIAIDAQAAIGNLRNDEDARDRHAEAVSEALALLNRCKGNNAAARLSLRLENYLAAAATDLENAKPSLLVQRGEKLRQELAAYAAPDTLLDPIADDILVDLKGWQSAHNMLVGLDPVLMAIDSAMLGPDGRPALMSPDEIREFAHDAQQADLLAEGTEVILVETADLAPEIPDPTNRLTNASIEMVRNLCIETVSIALNHPMVTAGVAVTTVALSSNVVAGIVGGLSLMSSIKAAEYLVIHRQWVEEKMGNTPTWQSLLSQVADWLEKVTPFKPK